MAIRVVQQLERADRQTLTVPYWVDDDTGVHVGMAAAQTAAITQFNADFGLPATDWPAERRADGVVVVTMMYAPAQYPQSDPPWSPPLGGYAVPQVDYEFFFEPKPQKFMKQGLGHVWHTTDAPPHAGKLNIVYEHGIMKTEGANIVLPDPTHRVRYVVPNANITSAYQKVVEDLCGCVNSTTFRGRAAGEVMLVRVNGTKRTQSDWELTFEFATGVTQAAIVLDGVTFNPPGGVKPFDYPWVLSRTLTLPFLSSFITIDAGAFGYIERVWPHKDLNALLLP